jgi:hypothetical protein
MTEWNQAIFFFEDLDLAYFSHLSLNLNLVFNWSTSKNEWVIFTTQSLFMQKQDFMNEQ